MIATRVRFVRSGVCAALLLLSACSGDSSTSAAGSKTLAQIKPGMANDDIFTVIGKGPTLALPADSAQFANGYRRTQVVNGADLITVIWFREVPGTATEQFDRTKDTPIVLGTLNVLGTGWSFYDSAAVSLHLPEVPKAK